MNGSQPVRARVPPPSLCVSAGGGGDRHAQAQIETLVTTRAKDKFPTIRIPYLDEDVHDLAGLYRISEYIFGTREDRAAANE